MKSLQWDAYHFWLPAPLETWKRFCLHKLPVRRLSNISNIYGRTVMPSRNVGTLRNNAELTHLQNTFVNKQQKNLIRISRKMKGAQAPIYGVSCIPILSSAKYWSVSLALSFNWVTLEGQTEIRRAFRIDKVVSIIMRQIHRQLDHTRLPPINDRFPVGIKKHSRRARTCTLGHSSSSSW